MVVVRNSVRTCRRSREAGFARLWEQVDLVYDIIHSQSHLFYSRRVPERNWSFRRTARIDCGSLHFGRTLLAHSPRHLLGCDAL